MTDFGSTVFQARTKRGLSMRDAARVVGITMTELGAIERVNHDPAPDVAARIVEAFGIDAPRMVWVPVELVRAAIQTCDESGWRVTGPLVDAIDALRPFAGEGAGE